jgi:N-acetylmuramoyl-L-alanine amidase
MSERAEERLAGRRRLIKFAGASLFLTVSQVSQASAKRSPAVLAVRVWPAAEYTRVTIELSAPLKYTQFTVKNPDRLVVDLEGIELTSVLDSLSSKVLPDDPNIKLLRAGRYKPGVVRLVMELKTEVAPQVFELAPVGSYGHRLVLDVYPSTPPDPLLSLLDSKDWQVAPVESGLRSSPKAGPNQAPTPRPTRRSPEQLAEHRPVSKQRGRSVIDRLVTITLDPGHGGEDPGAIGSGGSYEKHVTLAVAKRLRAKIAADPNMRVVLTRDSDFFVPLRARVIKRVESSPTSSFRSMPTPLSGRTPMGRQCSFFPRAVPRVRRRVIWPRKRTPPT